VKAALWVAAALLAAVLAWPAAAAEPLTLRRLDCGVVDIPDLDFLSDTFVFSGRSKTVVVSCYLIGHGHTWLLWDAGLPLSRLGPGQRSVGGGNARLARPLVDQLADLGVKPEQISILALSHYHADHAGQAASFPKARMLIGAADWATVRGADAAFNLDRSQFAPWTASPPLGEVDPVSGDRDVFGDGSVVMLATPGHTPGHHSLMLRLAAAPVILTGDLWHFAEQVPIDGVPKINTSRAETLASMDRIRRTAQTLGAVVVIGHEPADIGKPSP